MLAVRGSGHFVSAGEGIRLGVDSPGGGKGIFEGGLQFWAFSSLAREGKDVRLLSCWESRVP